MPSLAIRKWYLAAMALMLGAIVAEFVAKSRISASVQAMARAAAVPAERASLHQRAARLLETAQPWWLGGIGLISLAIAAWVISSRKREPGLQGVLGSVEQPV